VINSRVGPRLTTDEIAELAERLDILAEEYARRPAHPDAVPVGLHLTLHLAATHDDDGPAPGPIESRPAR